MKKIKISKDEVKAELKKDQGLSIVTKENKDQPLKVTFSNKRIVAK